MNILNLGSLNFDKVYHVPHFVSEGETILSTGYQEFLGGKGLNQSLAIARAGVPVYHAGAIGPEGGPFLDCLEASGADTSLIARLETISGHAIIQNVDGRNCIIVCGGANQQVSREIIDHALSHFGPGDLLLLQNEVSNIPYAIRAAKARGLEIAFNASPITPALLQYPLELVDIFLVNEIEGKALADVLSNDHEAILRGLAARFPNARIVLTVGEKGVLYHDSTCDARHDSYRVKAVDTTAAGDTFSGYFLAGLARGMAVPQALRMASQASAIAVSRPGASSSIPTMEDVQAFAASHP